ncbi:MAG: protein kinase family protein [Deltaproteobacteria bacterium]|nr:protein kinase family protein [Deltaproteobacteria bacterium]
MEKITSFNFEAGRILANKYEVIQSIGKGWEGEVYLLREKNTKIERAAKFFFPHQNKNNKSLVRYAKKLHKLRHCSMVIQYLSQETIWFRKQPINFLVSEFVEGELLSDFMKRQKGKHLDPYTALHLLYALVQGMEEIHQLREYHGDLHTENIIVERFGLEFHLKLVDMYHWDQSYSRPENIKDDVCDMVRLFYEALGGAKYYSKQPGVIKEICCGLKKTLILKKFKSAKRLKNFIEALQWE